MYRLDQVGNPKYTGDRPAFIPNIESDIDVKVYLDHEKMYMDMSSEELMNTDIIKAYNASCEATNLPKIIMDIVSVPDARWHLFLVLICFATSGVTDNVTKLKNNLRHVLAHRKKEVERIEENMKKMD
jgi:hypothetical protein